MACVQWAHNKTTRAIRHIQLRENAVREAIQQGLVDVVHIAGKDNMADIFTKEDRDVAHYIRIRNILLSPPPQSIFPQAAYIRMYSSHILDTVNTDSVRTCSHTITRPMGGISSSCPT